MVKNELRKIQKNSDNKDLALLAQEVGFLVERFDDFKKETAKDFQEVKDNTSGTYGSKTIQDDHGRRINRIEKAALGVLIFVFLAFGTAVVGLVMTGGGQ